MRYLLYFAFTLLQFGDLNAVPLNMNDVHGQNHSVGRAGILPVIDYGQDDINGPGSRHAVILGVTTYNQCASPFSGQCDDTDGSVWDAAARECVEETSGAIDLRRAPRPLPDVTFSGLPSQGSQNALFILFDNTISVNNITNHNRRALSGEIYADKPGCWKENSRAIAIDFPTLHALLILSSEGRLKHGMIVKAKERSGIETYL
jgi:hypothetical protein